MKLLADLIRRSTDRDPSAVALVHDDRTLSYGELAQRIEWASRGLVEAGLGRGERVGVYLDKRFAFVEATFGASAAGGVFVPINPILKARQVGHILRDCNVRMLVTTADRLRLLTGELDQCADLRRVVLVDGAAAADGEAKYSLCRWTDLLDAGRSSRSRLHRTIDVDMTAILYTSGSTGLPKGVVLSHRNLVAGAESVSHYLDNRPTDRILSVLPLSFDAGLSQLTTAFNAAASVVLLNYLLPQDVIRALAGQRITGLTGVPPLWAQLCDLEWPASIRQHLRYIANTGGAMPRVTLDKLRAKIPETLVYLMYGLTEAFRSTYLPPSEIDRRPGSIGKAIPNAEILVVGDDGHICGPGETGELVHRGALVSLGYWNDPQRTAERFRPAPGLSPGLQLPEIAVWSGDTVRLDDEGYLYFVGRRDEMIKTSGYRVSPTEVEEIIYASGTVREVVALGIPHAVLGQVIVAIAAPMDGATVDADKLLEYCRKEMPAYMVPQRIVVVKSIARSANGKFDRAGLARQLADTREAETV